MKTHNNDPDEVSNGKQAARKFPRRSKDQKSTPVNVSTYSTQRRDKENKMKMKYYLFCCPTQSVHGERANFTRLVLGCIDAKYCK